MKRLKTCVVAYEFEEPPPTVRADGDSANGGGDMAPSPKPSISIPIPGNTVVCSAVEEVVEETNHGDISEREEDTDA